MKRYISILLLLFSLMLSVNAQTIQNSSVKISYVGWHSESSPRRADSRCWGISGDKLYLSTWLLQNGLKSRDSLYCYNLETGLIESKAASSGNFLCLCPDGSLKSFRNEYDWKERTFQVFCDNLNSRTLEKSSSQKLMEKVLAKNPNYSCSYSLSPDSSKIMCFVTVETEKNNYSHYYVLYDLKTDEFVKNEVSFKTSSPFYSVMDINLTNNGEMIFILKTYKKKNTSSFSDIETLWVDQEGDAQHTVFSLPEKTDLRYFNSKVLRGGNFVFTAVLRNLSPVSGNGYDLYYSVFNKKMIEEGTVDYKQHRFDDVWYDKQGESVTLYRDLDVSNINELDNGKIMLTGFPCSLYDGNFKWGGFYNLMLTPNGTLEKSSYIERMARRLKISMTRSPRYVDTYYDAFVYGNNLYLLFNESVKKVEAGKQNAGYKPGSQAYITLWQVGADEEKAYNLSGSTPSNFAYNRFLARKGNKFYVLTRDFNRATIGSFELPEIRPARVEGVPAGRDSASVGGSSGKTADSNAKTPAKTKSNPRKRSVKK
ncbi:MAG: hypothetical protein IKP37_09950 [Paludibacteraceae bacterium]|nr:hypothetical protein [Paludibacteraceae bacterium]